MKERSSSKAKKDQFCINTIPLCVGLFAFVIIKVLVKDGQLVDGKIGLDICSTMMGVWATCLGFMITAVSILLVVNSGKYIEMLKETEHYKTVLKCLMSCCVHLLMVLVLMTFFTIQQKWSKNVFAILCSSSIDVFIIMGFCLYFLWHVIVHIDD